MLSNFGSLAGMEALGASLESTFFQASGWKSILVFEKPFPRRRREKIGTFMLAPLSLPPPPLSSPPSFLSASPCLVILPGAGLKRYCFGLRVYVCACVRV